MERIFAMVLGAVLLASGLAWGDSTIESTIKTGGIKGMGASEGPLVKRYQGDKMYESTSTQFTGAVLSRISGGSEGVSITRVDKGVYWSLDPKNKTYTERAIEPFKKGELEERPEKEKARVRVTKSEFTVKKTGSSETINGFPCEEYLLTWLLEMEDIATKAKTRNTMTTNLWTTPETAAIRKAQAEEQEFHMALARKLDLSFSPNEAKQLGMEALGTMSGVPPDEIEKGFKRVKEEMSKIKGYSIRSVVSWAVEGDKGSAGKEGTSPSETTSDSLRSIGGVLGGLAGKFTQKVTGEKPGSTGGKEGPFFSCTTEVRTINTDSIPSEVFEIPGGYMKK
jgi:hypothetical protein